MPTARGALRVEHSLPLAHEIARKAIHIAACLVAAALTWNAPPTLARLVLLAVAALAIGADLARLRLPTLHHRFLRLVGPLFRPREDRRMSGASMLALGLALTVLLFPRRFAMAGLLFAGLADAAGAIVGRAFGRHPFPWGRTLEGSTAFFLAAVLAGCLVPGIDPAHALLAALPVALLESAPLRVNDNLIVPLAGALATLLATVLL